MKATIIRADEVKAGNRILFAKQILKVTEIFPLGGRTAVWIEFEEHIGKDFGRTELVARIDPEPVEEREKWRATCGHVRCYGSEIQMRHWADAQKDPVAIEHVRETVLSREEIKPQTA